MRKIIEVSSTDFRNLKSQTSVGTPARIERENMGCLIRLILRQAGRQAGRLAETVQTQHLWTGPAIEDGREASLFSDRIQ